MVQRDAESRRYGLGHGLQLLTRTAAHSGPDLYRICTPAVQRLAEESGDTVFLSARGGLFTVCVDRATGDYPIRAITVEIGSRRPFGIGAGGLAILGSLPAAESKRIVEVLRPKLGAFPLSSATQILRSQRQARCVGFALSDEKVAVGVRAVRVALCDSRRVPVAAIGLAAIRQRLSTERMLKPVALLNRNAFRSRSSSPSRLLRFRHEWFRLALRPIAAVFLVSHQSRRWQR